MFAYKISKLSKPYVSKTKWGRWGYHCAMCMTSRYADNWELALYRACVHVKHSDLHREMTRLRNLRTRK